MTMKARIDGLVGRSVRRCVSVVAASATLFSVGASAHEPVSVGLITAPFGTGSYLLGSALEEISKKKHPWLHITHAESPGFIFNIKKLDKEPELRKTMMVGSGGGVSGLAQAGESPFDKKYAPLKLIANYSLGTYWLATIKPDVKTVADLAGKKVALGRAAQINWAVQPAWILAHGYGLTRGKLDLQYVGTKEAVDAVLDGTADAGVVGGYFDPVSMKMVLSPQTSEFLASGRKITQLSWDAEAVRKSKTGTMKFSQVTIPANAIPNVAMPIEAAADTTSWMVSTDFPEELAYEITKLIIQNIGEFGDFHALGKLMSPAGMVYGWDVADIHPGALRAYREAGIIQ